MRKLVGGPRSPRSGGPKVGVGERRSTGLSSIPRLLVEVPASTTMFRAIVAVEVRIYALFWPLSLPQRTKRARWAPQGLFLSLSPSKL